jgi:hypothetical protein
MEDTIRALVSDGKLAPNKGKKDEELPAEYRKAKEWFADDKIEGWLSGKYLDNDDPFVAKTAKIISGKAPIALRLANRIIDEGYELPLSEAIQKELVHLNEIFSTADALTGLASVGKGRPTFEGK